MHAKGHGKHSATGCGDGDGFELGSRRVQRSCHSNRTPARSWLIWLRILTEKSDLEGVLLVSESLSSLHGAVEDC